MDWLVQIFNWVANNEAVLSGIAAVIAIIAVVFALTYRAFRLWRGRGPKSDSADHLCFMFSPGGYFPLNSAGLLSMKDAMPSFASSEEEVTRRISGIKAMAASSPSLMYARFACLMY